MIRVLIMHTENKTPGNIRESLYKCNLNLEIDAHNLQFLKNPKLSNLLNYDVILFDSIGQLVRDKEELGNLLADYVDTGKGLVLCAISNRKDSHQRIAGRFEAQNYHPFTYAPYVTKSFATLNKKVLPEHPLLNNVYKLTHGKDSPNTDCKVTKDATLVACYAKNCPLMAYKKKNGMIVALNMIAANNELLPYSWHSETDGHWLLYNSIVFAAQIRPLFQHEKLMNSPTFQDIQILFQCT